MFPGGQKKSFFINNYYEITDTVLGCGSFSTVYLARHVTFGNQVAFKVVDRNDIKEEYVRKNLHREAKILKKLNHPNVVNFYEEISENNLYCLSMEYIKGEDLSQYLKKQEKSRVTEKVAKTLFYQIVSAVDHLHYNNVLHRDLKQENILLEHGKLIKIVDFGLSNIYTPRVKLRTHCGSMVYAAPELFLNRSVYGAGVDLWSLGVILYSMVTGQMPFELSKHVKGSSSSTHKKDLFFRRISKGLTQENYIIMQVLSLDCCNLLKNLLQPDQFKRMQIQATILHPWFHKDADLKKRLPKYRTDLREKFTPEIIDFMADKMHVSRQRVQNHIRNNKFDAITAMFKILRDTLLKEILYPPKGVESSLLLQFEKWRKGLTADESTADDSTIGKNFTVRSQANFTRHPQLLVKVPRKASKHDLQDRSVYENATNFARETHYKDTQKEILIAQKQALNNNYTAPIDNDLRRHSNVNTTAPSVSRQAFSSGNSVHNSNRLAHPLQTHDTMKISIAQREFAENSTRNSSTFRKQSNLSSYQKNDMDGKEQPFVCSRRGIIEYFNNIGFSGIQRMRARAGDGISNCKSNNDKSSTEHDRSEGIAQSKIPVRTKQPVKSYKNSRPIKVNASAKQNLTQGNQEPANTHERKEHSKHVEDILNTKEKVAILNKNHNQTDDKPRNKPENGNRSSIQNDLNAQLRRRKLFENTALPNAQYTDSTTRQFRRADDITIDSDSYNVIPKQCESYLQRNILISRADRGIGRTFFNTNLIRPRSFKNNVSSTTGQTQQYHGNEERLQNI